MKRIVVVTILPLFGCTSQQQETECVRLESPTVFDGTRVDDEAKDTLRAELQLHESPRLVVDVGGKPAACGSNLETTLLRALALCRFLQELGVPKEKLTLVLYARGAQTVIRRGP